MIEPQRFEIPSAFWLGSERIAVVWDPQLIMRDDDIGQACYREFVIKMQPNSQTQPRPHSAMEKTFLHELVHWILYVMRESDLKSNEKFVNIFGTLLHQALTMRE